MKKVIYLFILLVSTNTFSKQQFIPADPNKGYRSIMGKVKDFSFMINPDYLRVSIKGKSTLMSSGGAVSSSSPRNVAANSVIIENGVILDGDLNINIEINGDTYVSNR